MAKCSTHAGGCTVSSSETPVPGCRVSLAGRQRALALSFASAPRPSQSGRWRGLFRVEGGELALHPRGYQ
eukprot:1392654-Pleurochrysis_carterae.AAC.1